MENNTKQRTMDLEAPAIVVNKSQFPEPVHEKTDSRAGGADHFCQHLLADLGNYGLGFAFLAKMSEQQKDSGQPLFAGIKELINQIFFVTDVPRQQTGHEQVGKFVLERREIPVCLARRPAPEYGSNRVAGQVLKGICADSCDDGRCGFPT